METNKKIIEQMKRYRLSLGVASVGFIGIGVLFLLLKATAVLNITAILGIIMFLAGGAMVTVYYFARKRNHVLVSQLVMGFILLVLGSVVFFNKEQYSIMLPLFLGLYMVVVGTFCVELGGVSNKINKNTLDLIVQTLGVILLVVGTIFAFNPFSNLEVAPIVLGVVMVFVGVVGIIWEVYFATIATRVEKFNSELVEK